MFVFRYLGIPVKVITVKRACLGQVVTTETGITYVASTVWKNLGEPLNVYDIYDKPVTFDSG